MPGQLNYLNYQPHPPTNYLKEDRGSNWSLRQSVHCLLLAILCISGISCEKLGFGDKDKPKNDPSEKPTIPVEVAILGLGPIESVLKASSNLEAESEVNVLARTSNRVKDLFVEEGSQVKAGDLLLQLDDDIQTIQVSKAKNQVLESREEYDRQKSLHAQNLISDQVFSQSKFQLQQLELNLQDAERELGYTQIHAPIHGKITQRMVKVGDQVSAGQDLFTVIDFDSIVARLYVTEKALSKIQENQMVRIESTAFPEKVFNGYVARIAPVVESKSGMIKVTVGFQDVGPLLPGMYVDGSIITSSKPDALLLPKKGILYDGEQRFIFRVKENSEVERVLLNAGLEDAENVEPISLLKQGDQIVIAGQTGLKDGSRVQLPDDTDENPNQEIPMTLPQTSDSESSRD
ncbi:MAG: efflux RND transporter periplasmic adaptor subunit [Verrucomicrobia bacterium]|jgi:membrane fusion protein (multidrug efflux system)|nr:efflux RND transporter periplasmic adaptor subunit [Verrucomicrobiota bacterium]